MVNVVFVVIAISNERAKSITIESGELKKFFFFIDVDLTTFVEHTCASDNVVSVILRKIKMISFISVI